VKGSPLKRMQRNSEKQDRIGFLFIIIGKIG
jgi:hypothetical protein